MASEKIQKNSGGLSEYIKFNAVEIHRSELKNAPYNPRQLSEAAKVKLKRSLSNFGLVEPPVWNARTGNIVGGHQRIAVLDSLEGSKDYRITVAKVDVEPKREKELNVILNNTLAMGDYDLEKLQELLKEVDTEMAGFDKTDIFRMFGDDFLAQDAAAISELSDQIRAANDRYLNLQKTVTDQRDNSDYYTVLVFRDTEHRQKVLKMLGFDDNKWVSGEELEKMIAHEDEPATTTEAT